MRLKYININGYGLLVDGSVDIKERLSDKYGKRFKEGSMIYYSQTNSVFKKTSVNICTGNFQSEFCFEIIFAEKELNLDVPILPNWRQWEVERAATEAVICNGGLITTEDEQDVAYSYFIAGYNHNKAKYTEEDLMKAIEMVLQKYVEEYQKGEPKLIHQYQNEIIQSLQKYPKYIEMEDSYPTNCCIIKDGALTRMNKGCSERNRCIEPKLITNSEGKQECIIKEIIY